MPNLISCLIFSIFICINSIQAAEVTYRYLSSPKEDKFSCLSEIYLNGEIKKGDSSKVKKLLDQICYDKSYYSSGIVSITVRLNSIGGDVEESLAIGRAIRDKQAHTSVWHDDICYSSCVFIFAGGVYKTAAGKIGIHRPYFNDLNPNTSMSDIQKIRQRQKKIMSEYLEEMDVSQNLLEEMMSIPPEQIKILRDDSLDRFRLTGRDANYDEKVISQFANDYGLTSSEYRKRDILVNEKCGPISSGISSMPNYNPNYSICSTAIFYGISETQVIERRRKVRIQCKGLTNDNLTQCVNRIYKNG